jgi:hypothetical protein
MRGYFVLIAVAGMLAPAAAEELHHGWGKRAELIEPNSEFAVAELDGKIYVLGGYPASRETQRIVQVYAIASDRATAGRSVRHCRSPTITGWLLE